MKKGILVAGHLCVDNMYPCRTYPKEGELTYVLEGIKKSTGGIINNTAKDIARLAPDMPVSVSGCVGDDGDGDYIVSLLKEYPNIDVSGIRRAGRTGFTNVMTNEATKTRTFFQYSGANALYSEDYLDLSAVSADILHIGYILLLPALDAEDEEYGTKMARLLHNAKKAGLRTSIDVVSETGGRTKKLVPPALKFTDYCIINELEASAATGLPLRSPEGQLITENLAPALRALRSMGVSTWTVIHAPECAAGLNESGDFFRINSLKLPEGYIQGTTGAGDAFAAGVLVGAEKGLTLESALRLGICSAAASLKEADATSGVKEAEEVLKLYEMYGE